MNPGQRHHPEERQAYLEDEEKHCTLIVTGEPAMLSPAQPVLQKALIERGRVFAAVAPLHQPS
ncbi:hypothetical protein [Dyella acidiphila]|uniref:Uncharacterized protein n=1 Tax=Dyella acidiphila TaxID=2775866 RepID=A0ABR9GBW9_9GAMM|nr:hypothetical protein [Dyella acidiphila]MBE1161530.1 hypothetical protein [Dyella acidiphila]